MIGCRHITVAEYSRFFGKVRDMPLIFQACFERSGDIYDGIAECECIDTSQNRQEKADKLHAERIGRLVDKMQKEQTEDLINSVLGDEELPIGDEEAVRELLHEYVSNKDEYLVDGAVLTCSMASTGTYLIGNVGLGTEIKNIENPTHTRLWVSSNLSEINGKPVATVKDHKKYWETGNIEPFKCNCLSFPDRESEREAILNDEECRKYGICRQLMKLDSDWENFIKSTGYLSFSRTTEKERAQGITMKSVLFCSHGGLITPVTSGQIDNELYALLLKNREELTDEDLILLGFIFQRSGENERIKIFNYLFYPNLNLEGESYAEKVLKKHILYLNEAKVPSVAEKYINALNKLGINNNKYTIDDMIELLSWNQEKINQTYNECLKFSIETGILISPKLALAIIGTEGTGSYDTNAKVASEYNNGNGPQHDFGLDTEQALNLLKGKLAGFIVYKDDYISAGQINGAEDKHLITYLCGKTPILGKNQTGVYAESSSWIDVVEEKYQKYSKNTEEDDRDYVKDYETFLEGYDKDTMEIKDSVQYEFVYENGKVVARQK